MKQSFFNIDFPAEWEPQSGIMLSWPHPDTDWKDMLNEVIPCFKAIAKEILKREKLLIVCSCISDVKMALECEDDARIIFREIPSNDTWARDHGPVSVFVNGEPFLLDFMFNGWGLKFPADRDNQITRRLYENGVFSPQTSYKSMLHVVLEGGSIETDGAGTILTTSKCLLSVNRNEYKSKAEISDYLQWILGAKHVLWLDKGYLAGDDTDSHIDMLARFCNSKTIAYVQCTDENDEHYSELLQMEEELRKFKSLDGEPYQLLPLPMAEAVYFEGERLPASYANFLIINEAVLLPFYDSPLDEIARQQLQKAFPDREIIGINCLPLIRQHGSLHCCTMQLPKNFLKE
ncbi:MAG: agmatine deiminase family protein [Dysgonamonadaceae bacterium]|jgi:agmatine/peptidylarginine deiminase|nr:agmatine deiminase family protein [Dysgonamonadaceae bacterium]